MKTFDEFISESMFTTDEVTMVLKGGYQDAPSKVNGIVRKMKKKSGGMFTKAKDPSATELTPLKNKSGNSVATVELFQDYLNYGGSPIRFESKPNRYDVTGGKVAQGLIEADWIDDQVKEGDVVYVVWKAHDSMKLYNEISKN